MKKEKQLLLNEVTSYIKKDPTFLLMSYSKLNANRANEFRREIVKRGGHVAVMRKRMLVKAAKESGFSLDEKTLKGHIGVVFGGDDFLETTKYTFTFGKSCDNAVEVIGGRFEGEVHNASAMLMLSQLPGKDEMRAQLLGILQAPLVETLLVIDALLCSVPCCLENKVKIES